MKVIDSFIFFNEIELLKLRLKELDKVVDHFVLVEATKTFSNKNKNLIYQDRKNEFSDYAEKITHVIVENMPPNRFWRSTRRSAWIRQELQRNRIAEGIESLSPSPEDLILISDVDEIPDPETIGRLKQSGHDEIANLVQDLYYYDLSWKHPEKWTLPILASYRKIQPHLDNLHQLRIQRSTMEKKTLIQRGGWHFSYFGGVDAIITKIQNISAHTEINKPEIANRENIKRLIKEGKDLLLRNDIDDFQYIDPSKNSYLPANVNMLTAG
jgi:beta-1,4-mannosyl-glycoprotein beta-1,4-N-acetylglucosaminyltransferase